MSQATFPPSLLRGFIETAREVAEPATLAALFKQHDLPESWLDPGTAARLDATAAADAYVSIQRAMSIYFGRGARLTLLRIGRILWVHALDNAPVGIKAQSRIVRGLPAGLRPKAALEMLARLLGGRDQVSVHTLDLELVLVDRASPLPQNLHGEATVCYVTLGLIQGALSWATGREVDVEETSCRAAGAATCEFRIKTGG
ncbi:MAG: V4R domain-containing protein [Chloroflexota bacterium]